jgi:Ca2+-binding RTX toxin-like protein
MPTVTVAGAAGATVTLVLDSESNAALARQLAGSITAGVANGTLAPASSKAGPPPTLPGGQAGEWVQEGNGATFLPGGYTAIVSTAPKATIFGTGEENASVLGSSGSLTFFANGGSGTVVAGGGANRIYVPGGGTGAWSINTGGGDDNIQALGDGDDTIRAGGGRNTIQLGGGNDTVESTGKDRIVLGHGSATIVADGASTQVWGGSGGMFFVGGAGNKATVFGGTGSATILGGDGPNEFHGGSAGNNEIYAGTGKATIFGGGDGDILYAEGDRRQELHASDGATTLFGALAGGDNTFHAGAGDTAITGGWGDDTFIAGLGDSTITGGPGADTYTFIDGLSGGADLIYGFGSDDTIKLEGYGKNAVADALASQVKVAGGVMITLADSTTVTFMGLSSLTKADFTGGGGPSDHGPSHHC